MKWDDDPSVRFPLWVADMDFPACPAILQALERRVRHGIFGYAQPTAAYYDAIVEWHKAEHAANYDPEWFIVVPGIVPAISAILRALTRPGDGVLLLSPAYNCFYSSIRNLQCRAEESELRLAEGAYRIDFDDLERRASQPDVRIMLLCSPHNPTGRVWTADELRRILEICRRNDVVVVSDEIHCELTMPGHKFVPFAQVASQEAFDRWILCTSASKAFNIAGLQNAQIIVPDPDLRRRVDRAVNIHEVCDVNPLGIVATQAAYTEGREWLCSLRQYLWQNYQAASQFIRSEMPQLGLTALEATYLLWVDIRSLTDDDKSFCRQIRAQSGVRLAPGSHYGKGGAGHVRINLATQRAALFEALKLMKSTIIH